MFREKRLVYENKGWEEILSGVLGSSNKAEVNEKARRAQKELFEAISEGDYLEAVELGIEWLLLEIGVDVDSKMIIDEEKTEYREASTKSFDYTPKYHSGFSDGVKKFVTSPAKKSFFEDWHDKWDGIKGKDGDSYIENGKHYQSETLEDKRKREVTARIEEKGYFMSAENHGWKKREPLILVCNQTMYLYLLKEGVSEMDPSDPDSFYLYKVPCSTGRKGWGYRNGSNMTPPGHAKLKKETMYARKPTDGIATVFGTVHGIDSKTNDPVAQKLSNDITDKNPDDRSDVSLAAKRGIGFHDSNNKNFGTNTNKQTRAGRSAGCFRTPTGAMLAIWQQVQEYGTAHIISTPVELDEDSLPYSNV